ncbi:hypothetical protein GOB93_05485 [Acetobacter musti]|uniref:Uncharacterized protein n=1 Tax=Acetobacter musti TaxID=864732 RepID=A0ABX0JQD1_9PROT|nr:hypothetical protein [Acetobacter musti]NHN84095.1 hypothetical protein [Acetobacter musti]
MKRLVTETSRHDPHRWCPSQAAPVIDGDCRGAFLRWRLSSFVLPGETA